MKRLALAATLIVSAGAFTSDAVRASDDNTSCTGNLVEYVPFKQDGQKIGQLQLYYNATSRNFCALMFHGGPTWGVRLDTGVAIVRSRTRDGTFYTAGDPERGQFRYQAGPINRGGAGWCGYGSGLLNYRGKQQIKNTAIVCR